MDLRPKSKTITYPHLCAEIDYEAGTMTLTVEQTGNAIVLERAWYPELQAIMADLGHQSPSGARMRGN